ncbi:MAG: penicillin-binding protein 2 [Patescibacteria group bacterium]
MPQIPEKIFQSRLALVRLAFFIFFAIIILRLFEVQVLDQSLYAALASNQHDVLAELFPVRGNILTRDSLSENGVYPVAVNRKLWQVYSVPRDVTDALEAANKLSPLLGLPSEEILTRLASDPTDPYEPLAHELSDEAVEQINKLNLAGIKTAPETVRFYPEAELYSQILGFIGFADDKKVGRYGVEQYVEEILAGAPGKLISEKDPGGRLIMSASRSIVPAVAGADVVLTIDKNIQFQSCRALQSAVKKHEARGGSVLIINPKDGAILALCSTPSFDPNNYRAVSDIGRFLNPISSTAYEIGSVFKPITMALALDAGKVTADTVYDDTGSLIFGPDVIKNSDGKAHGLQTMTQVLEESLNTGAIFAMRQVGKKEFGEGVKNFGFGEVTGIELPHESVGNIKSLNEKQEIYFATASFGQGITATPLQMAQAFGAIANKGKLIRPHLISEIRYADGSVLKTEPTLVRQVIKPETATTLGAMLVSVVENGHGKRAGVPGYYVAGKTGTAEISLSGGGGYEKHKNIGTFIGFAPLNDPKFVMITKIVEPQGLVFAESSAAPLFGELAKYLLQYYQVPPERKVSK